MTTTAAFSLTASFFFRFELLDAVHIPSSVKFTEQQVLQYLHHFVQELWTATYKTIGFRQLRMPPSEEEVETEGLSSGTCRSALPLFITLKDWLLFGDTIKILHLGATYKRALWLRFAVELHALQTAGYIRDAIRLGESNNQLLCSNSFELAFIEFRTFALLLWLQAFRQGKLSALTFASTSRAAAINAANSEASPRGQSTSPSGFTHSQQQTQQTQISSSTRRTTTSAVISPRQQHPQSQQTRRSDFLTTGSTGNANTGTTGPSHEEAVSMIKDAFTDSIKTILCIIGFHFEYALAQLQTDSVQTTGTSSLESHINDGKIVVETDQQQQQQLGVQVKERDQTETTINANLRRTGEPALSLLHLKYLALVLQLRQSMDSSVSSGCSTPHSCSSYSCSSSAVSASSSSSSSFLRKAPTPSVVLENTLFSEFSKYGGVVADTPTTSLISISAAENWFRHAMVLSLASADICTSSIFNSCALMAFPTASNTTSSSGNCTAIISDAANRRFPSAVLRNNSPTSPRGATTAAIMAAFGHATAAQLPNDAHQTDETATTTTATVNPVASTLNRRNSTGIGKNRSSSADHYLVMGKRRDVCLVATNNFPVRDVPLSTGLPHPQHCSDLTVMDCVDTTVYGLGCFRNVKITHCRNCIVILPAVSASVIIMFCRNITAHVASVGLLIANSYDIDISTLCITPPIIAGDTRDIVMGPYNVIMYGQRTLMNHAGFDFGPNTINGFTTSLVVQLSGGGRAAGGVATPRETDHGSTAVRSNLTATVDEGFRPALRPLADFSVVVVPGESSSAISGLLPSEPVGMENSDSLVLPQVYAEALEKKRRRTSSLLLKFLTKLESFESEKEMEDFLQKVESRFSDWLIRTDIKQYMSIGWLNKHYEAAEKAAAAAAGTDKRPEEETARSSS